MQHRFWSRIRWLVSAAMVCLVLVVVVVLKFGPAVSTFSSPEAAKPTSDDRPYLTISHLEYSDVRKGRTYYTVQADTGRHYDQEQRTLLTKVNAVFFQKDGGEIILVADEGVIDHATKNMEARGHVQVNYNGIYDITTDRLFYDDAQDRISTPDPVLIIGRGLTLRGVGATMEMAGHSMKVLSRVDTRLEGVRLGGPAGQG
jgi:lipopolysaccharide export system protein LptC